MLMVKMDLAIKRTKYWTDKKIVLHYLKNAKCPLETYVDNRVEEIRANSQPDRWNHVPGFLKQADDVLRDLTPLELNLNHRWLQGPEFLWRLES